MMMPTHGVRRPLNKRNIVRHDKTTTRTTTVSSAVKQMLMRSKMPSMGTPYAVSARIITTQRMNTMFTMMSSDARATLIWTVYLPVG